MRKSVVIKSHTIYTSRAALFLYMKFRGNTVIHTLPLRESLAQIVCRQCVGGELKIEVSVTAGAGQSNRKETIARAYVSVYRC